jgi:ribonuclease D
MNKSTVFTGIVSLGSLAGIGVLIGYLTHLTVKSNEADRQLKAEKEEKARQDQLRREQFAHDEKMELYKGMSPEQKSELMKAELEVDREKAKSKEKLASMADDLEARISSSIDKKYADKFERMDASLYTCQKALKSINSTDQTIRFTLG